MVDKCLTDRFDVHQLFESISVSYTHLTLPPTPYV